MHTIFVVFGSTGDLAKRRIFPALYNIFRNKKEWETDIIGVGRRDFKLSEFQSYIRKETIPFIEQKDDFSKFLSTVSYSKVEINNGEDYRLLESDIKKYLRKDSEIIFYLSIAPEHFGSFVDNAAQLKLNNIKIIFEKPFGKDLASAQKLNSKIMEVFREEQVYRIDHYVGKEAIQNILAFRFANIMFEPIWNNRYIDNIQITASESIGVGDRGGYYDVSGALRDMVQNHLFQVLSLIVMDSPSHIDALGIRQEKLKVLRSIQLGKNFENNIIFGQYKGYLDEKDVSKGSRTETFTAMKLEVHSWRFIGVPIYLRTGKCMNNRSTFIVVEFKEIPDILFKKFGHIEKNRIILEIQPNEGIDIHFNIKQNGNSKEVERVKSKFKKELESKEAYEKLIEDAIIGDKTLFTSWDMLEASWRIVDDLVNCKHNCPFVYSYEKGTNGPQESDTLLLQDNKHWYEYNIGNK